MHPRNERTSQVNQILHDRMVGDLTLRSYAKRCIGPYVRAVSQLQNFCCKELEEVTEEDLRGGRHYGFLAPNFGVSIQRIRELICILYETLRAWLRRLPTRKPSHPLLCKHCGTRLRWIRYLPPPRCCPMPT